MGTLQQTDFGDLDSEEEIQCGWLGLTLAIQTDAMFNLTASNEGDKVDFWMLTSHPFDRSRFDRRRFEEALGVRLAVFTPEDTILAKLDWAQKSGGSEKQFGDALSVYEVQFSTLDFRA